MTGPQYQEVLYPTTGANAAVNPSVTSLNLSGANLVFGNKTLEVALGQLSSNVAGGANAATMGANAADNNTDGLPDTPAQAGWYKLKTKLDGNNLVTIYIPYWKD